MALRAWSRLTPGIPPAPQIPLGSGWLLEYAYGLNERGQIVGGGHREGVAQIRAFVLTRSGQQDNGEDGDESPGTPSRSRSVAGLAAGARSRSARAWA